MDNTTTRLDLELQAAKRKRRAERFAAKWLAETESHEPPEIWETTDANLAHVFLGCVKPAPASLYPAIRSKLAGRSWLVV